MDLSALHPFLITKNDAQKLMALAGALGESVFKDGFSLHAQLSADSSYELTKAIETVIKQSNINPTDTKGLQSFFNNLQKEIEALPIIHIILAVSPKEKLLIQIHDWFYQNFQKTILLDIAVDTELIAGGIISFEGRANDYSLASKLEQMV